VRITNNESLLVAITLDNIAGQQVVSGEKDSVLAEVFAVAVAGALCFCLK
jgi:hypothetical protein